MLWFGYCWTTPLIQNFVGPMCYTPLRRAIEKNNRNQIDALLKKGANINYTDEAGKTPLHYAAQKAQYDTVGFLLERNADTEKADKQGNTPYVYAIARADGDVIAAFNDRGVW